MKKTAIGMLLVVILCFGCGDGNVEENEEKELQTMEEDSRVKEFKTFRYCDFRHRTRY